MVTQLEDAFEFGLYCIELHKRDEPAHWNYKHQSECMYCTQQVNPYHFLDAFKGGCELNSYRAICVSCAKQKGLIW